MYYRKLLQIFLPWQWNFSFWILPVAVGKPFSSVLWSLWVTQQCVFKIGNYWIGKWKKGQSSFMPSFMFLICCSLSGIDHNSYVENVCRLIVQVLPLCIRRGDDIKKHGERDQALLFHPVIPNFEHSSQDTASSFSIWLCTILSCS